MSRIRLVRQLSGNLGHYDRWCRIAMPRLFMNWLRTSGKSLSLLFSFLCCSCGSYLGQPDHEADIRIVDLRLAGAPIAWVDNHTILLRRDTGEKYRRKDGGISAVLRLATLNYLTGEQHLYGRAESQICYRDGYVSYIYEDERSGELVAAHGQLGKEQTFSVQPGQILFDDGPNGSCRPWKDRFPTPEWAKGRTAIMSLWPRTGVVACNVRSYAFDSQAVAASFHKGGLESGIPLPFSCFDVRRGLNYYAFKNAHFSAEYDLVSPWPANRDRKVYWLHGDGKVETITIPSSPIMREALIPTARGIFAFAGPPSGDEYIGVYLITPAGPKRVMWGYAAGVLSPDGCRFAVFHDPEYIRRLQHRQVSTQATVKVLEVCP